MKSIIFVGLFMGSDSDAEVMKKAKKVLEDFKIPFGTKVISAHRTADDVPPTVELFIKRGCRIFIAGAGHAAHLAGAIAGQTCLPVIGVPISSSALKGNDALLSTVQMPPGIPVATMGIDRADNAAIFAISMLMMSNYDLKLKLEDYRKKMADGVHAKHEKLIESGWPA